METQVSKFSILMFPWLAHGHIFPFLELAKAILHRKNLHIYLCSTSINFDSINAFISKHALHGSIELVQLHLEPFEDLPPDHHTTKNLPPSLMPTLIKAFQTSYTSFSDIISTLQPDLVVYDFFQSWSAKIAASQGIPAIHFSIYGATAYSLVHHKHTFGEAEVPFPGLKFEGHKLQEICDGLASLCSIIHGVDDQDFLFGNIKQSCDLVLLKSSRGVEGKCIDHLSTLSGKKIVPVGPLITHTKQNNQEKSYIIEWLSRKSQHSTVFISFGSECFLSKSEIEEIAKGLELCSVDFIWIIRFPLGATVSLDEVLPEGFLERAGERGLVVTGWAPQADILGHQNLGCFVSHCGWSSCMESMYFGVAVVAMPLKIDQPMNARMLVEAGSCVEVSRSEDGEFKGEEIGEAIRKVVEEEGGAEMRRRARGLSERLKREEAQVLDEAAEQLWQMCLKKHTTSC